MFDDVVDALRVRNCDIRLFGKPDSFVKHRMDLARVNAKKAAGMVKPRAA